MTTTTERIDVLAVMDAAEDDLSALGATANEPIKQLREARAAVAELIAERDKLANIVRSHEAQILRMTEERAELIASAEQCLTDIAPDWIRLSAALARVGAPYVDEEAGLRE